MNTLYFRNIHFVNATDAADFMQIGGHYVFFDERSGDYRTEIQNLLLENIEIHTQNGVATRGIIAKSSQIERMVFKGVFSDVCALETEGATVETLYLSEVYTPDCIEQSKLGGVKNLIVK